MEGRKTEEKKQGMNVWRAETEKEEGKEKEGGIVSKMKSKG